jgi:hypothetical protein
LDAGRALRSKIKYFFVYSNLCFFIGVARKLGMNEREVVRNSWMPHASNVASTPTKTNTLSDRNADCVVFRYILKGIGLFHLPG